MATEVPAEDDDAWLYGENNADEQRKEEINAIFDRATEDVVVPGEETDVTTNNSDAQVVSSETKVATNDEEAKPEEEGEEEKDSGDEDDSDDDIQVTIGDIKPTASGYPYGGAPVNLNIKRGAPYVGGAGAGGGSKAKGLDIETVGLINGVSMYEFNLDTIEDKPWRKPGADITDYFNYGFNEDTWRTYCEKQRKLRIDNNMVSKQVVQLVPGGNDQQIPIATVNENSKYSGVGVGAKKAGPPPGRRMSGSIDVICGANSSRRSLNAKENVIQVIGAGYDNSVAGLPPTHLPPPFIPPNLSVPPPGMPPGIPPNIPPPHFPIPDLYGNPMFSQPPPHVTVDSSSSQYDEQYFTGNSRNFDGNSESQHSWTNSPHRERDRDRDRDREREGRRDRDKDRDRYWDERRSGRGTDEDYKRREREDHDRRHYREFRDRRDKERYERDYDRDYDREHYERDRDRDSRERDRDRRHRETRDKERDERHKERSSRRRHHHEDEEDHHSSRHKHKKSKRDKDDASTPVLEETESTQPEIEEEEEK